MSRGHSPAPRRLPNGKARALQLCYLSPDCPIDREQLANLTNALPDRTTGSLAGLVKGMAHYRAGRFQDALEELDIGGDAWVKPSICFFRAMSYARMESAEQARQWLRAGIIQMVDVGLTIDTGWASHLPDRWMVQSVVDVIRREAQETVLGPECQQLKTAYGLIATGNLSGDMEPMNQAIQLDPDDFLLVAERGVLYARQRRWSDAAADHARAAKRTRDTRIWLQAAALFVLAGNERDYAQHCQEMLKHFEAHDQFGKAEQTSKACLLLADAVDLRKLPLETVHRGLDDDSAPNWILGWGFGTRALAAYRAGDAVKTVHWAHKSQETPAYASKLQLQALVLSVLAVAQHQLEQPEDAQKALTQASELIDVHLPKLATGELGGTWHDWLIAEILRREAEAVINGPAGEATVEAEDAAGLENQ